jgi:hypothetical protein
MARHRNDITFTETDERLAIHKYLTLYAPAPKGTTVVLGKVGVQAGGQCGVAVLLAGARRQR